MILVLGGNQAIISDCGHYNSQAVSAHVHSGLVLTLAADTYGRLVVRHLTCLLSRWRPNQSRFNVPVRLLFRVWL